jgi:hypothetical protein
MDDVPGVEILALCGVILEFPNTGKRISVTKRFQPDKSTIWEEEKNPAVLCAALSTTDPKAHEFLNDLLRRCLSYKHLAVMLRKGKNEPAIRSAATIPGRFKRTSKSLAGLMNVPWAPTLSYQDSLLETSHPHTGCKPDPTKMPQEQAEMNYMRFAVLDSFTGDSDERYIVEDLLVLWRAVYNVSALLQLCHKIVKPYVADGELEVEVNVERPERPFIPNLESGFAAYKALWGSFPKLQEEHEPAIFPTIWSVAVAERPSA